VHTSGFYLGCYQNKFSFDVIPQDSAGVVSTRAISTAAVPMGRWSSIVGVYDAGGGTIALYVNGVLQDTEPVSTRLWDAAGPFVVGRERYNDVNSWWTGDISDVHAWDRVAFQADIDALSASSWADQYPLGFNRIVDTKGSNPLTWTGNPKPGYDEMNPPSGGGGEPATLLNSADPDYATTAGPGVRTDGSFTVSAWVNPAASTSVYVNAVSQNGAVTSNFGLGLSSSNHYAFWMHGADTANPATTVIQSSAAAIPGRWVNLIGAFDFTTGTLTLYVNGLSQGSATLTTAPWHATGPVLIGAGWWQGSLGYAWNGGLDNVGLFNGVLNATEVDKLYTYNDPYHVSD
jgi:hypothetical protein